MVSSVHEIFLTRFTEGFDRIHRMGQRRPVQATKLVIEDSIESRIVQVNSNVVCPPSHAHLNWYTASGEEVRYG